MGPPEGLEWGLGTSVAGMRCPACTCVDDKVVDSRQADDGESIRRRRECLGCGRRYTTFERLEEASLVVVKRSGDREPFERAKLIAGVASAAKNRIDDDAVERLSCDVEEQLRLNGPDVPSELVGRLVLDNLRALDEVAYLRFASVYKGFADIADFQREVAVLTKSTEPKQRV